MTKEDKAKLDTLPQVLFIDCSQYQKMSDVMIKGIGGQWETIVSSRFGTLIFNDSTGVIGSLSYFYNQAQDEVEACGQLLVKKERLTDLSKSTDNQTPVCLYYTQSNDSGGLFQNNVSLVEW